MDGEARRLRAGIGPMDVRVLGWSAPVLLSAALLSTRVLPDSGLEEKRNAEGLIFVPVALSLLSRSAASLAVLSGGVLLAVRRRLPLQVVVPLLLSALVLVLVEAMVVVNVVG